MAKKKKEKQGWIKLHRQIMDNDLWNMPEPFDRRSAWIDLLMLMNHEPRAVPLRNGNIIYLEAGQHFTSMDTLAARWHWSRGKVIRYMKLLCKLEMCTCNATADGTTITVIKYSFFQGGRTANGTTDGTSGGTTDGTTDGTRTRNTKNNNIRMSNKNIAAQPLLDSGGYGIEE